MRMAYYFDEDGECDVLGSIRMLANSLAANGEVNCIARLYIFGPHLLVGFTVTRLGSMGLILTFGAGFDRIELSLSIGETISPSCKSGAGICALSGLPVSFEAARAIT